MISLPTDVSVVSVRGVPNVRTDVLYLFGQHPATGAVPTQLGTEHAPVLRDLGPGILLWEFLLYEEKKLYCAGRKG